MWRGNGKTFVKSSHQSTVVYPPQHGIGHVVLMTGGPVAWKCSKPSFVYYRDCQGAKEAAFIRGLMDFYNM